MVIELQFRLKYLTEAVIEVILVQSYRFVCDQILNPTTNTNRHLEVSAVDSYFQSFPLIFVNKRLSQLFHFLKRELFNAK